MSQDYSRLICASLSGAGKMGVANSPHLTSVAIGAEASPPPKLPLQILARMQLPKSPCSPMTVPLNSLESRLHAAIAFVPTAAREDIYPQVVFNGQAAWHLLLVASWNNSKDIMFHVRKQGGCWDSVCTAFMEKLPGNYVTMDTSCVGLTSSGIFLHYPRGLQEGHPLLCQ